MLKFLIIMHTLFIYSFKKSSFLIKFTPFITKVFYFNISKSSIYTFKLNQFFFKRSRRLKRRRAKLRTNKSNIRNIFSFRTPLRHIDLFYPNFFWKYYLVKMQINLFKLFPVNLLLKKKFFKISNSKLLGVCNNFNRLEFIMSLFWQIKNKKLQKSYLQKHLILINNKPSTNKNYFIKKNDTLLFLKNPIVFSKYLILLKRTKKNYILFFKKDWEINYLTQTVTKLNNNHYYLMYSYLSRFIRLFNWRTYVWKPSKTFLQK